jgi:hypothetical protein
MACPICKSEARLEVNAGLKSGELSQNEIARRFGISRASLQRHAKVCLKLSYAVSDEERKLAETRRRRQEGRLEDALNLAKKMLAAAEGKGDQVSAWRWGKEVSKLLTLLDRAAKKETRAAVAGKAQADFTNAFWDHVTIFPADCDLTFVSRFGGLREGSAEATEHEAALPKDRPVIRFRIRWHERCVSEIDRPMAAPEPESGPGGTE